MALYVISLTFDKLTIQACFQFQEEFKNVTEGMTLSLF